MITLQRMLSGLFCLGVFALASTTRAKEDCPPSALGALHGLGVVVIYVDFCVPNWLNGFVHCLQPQLRGSYHAIVWKQAYDRRSTAILLRSLSELPSLSSVEISDSSLWPNADLSVLSNHSELRVIELSDATDKHVRSLSNCKSIVRLNIAGRQLSDRSLEVVGRMRQLRSLSVMGERITDKGVSQLTALSSIRTLFLSSRSITDNSCPKIAQMPALKSLMMSGCSVTDKGAFQIRACRNLRSIDLSRTQVSDKFLSQLKTFPFIEEVYCQSTKISDEGLRRLSRNPPRLLRVLDVSFSSVTRKGINEFRQSNPGVRVRAFHLAGTTYDEL